MKILFITRRSERCGVADYGKRLFAILKQKLDISLREVDEGEQIDYTGYDVALYNYHHATLPHINTGYPIKHVALFHEAFINHRFDLLIPVPELVRPLIANYQPHRPKNDPPVIGSFGFGFPDKNFPGIARMVRDQFVDATLRLNIPFAQFGDDDGYHAMNEAKKCAAILSGTRINLSISHHFMEQGAMLEWLSMNDINVFNYVDSHGRGLSSATDYALSVKKPIAISRSEMFRHLPREICVDNCALPGIISHGVDMLYPVYAYHTNEKLINQIESWINR